ncbi:hypothetical protein ASD02_17335 [Ensifer sp. Root1252]|nr:hypothetical protein ASD02_17335 [Ensifer sp. Root1252]KRC57290.1 hypothetical protein ASE32_20650 [Ensifer sp. Root231]KRC87785.1 hypothetical protein ASE47_14805 [Ensifer sp. Root258]
MRTIAQTDTSALPQARDIYTLHEFAAVYDLGIGRAHELYDAIKTRHIDARNKPVQKLEIVASCASPTRPIGNMTLRRTARGNLNGRSQFEEKNETGEGEI